MEEAPSNEFFDKNMRHVKYGLQAREYKKMFQASLDNDIDNKENKTTASSKVVGVKWLMLTRSCV